MLVHAWATRSGASRSNAQVLASLVGLAAVSTASAASNSTNLANKFVVVGETGVSAQQLFRGQGNKVRHTLLCLRSPLMLQETQVYILDKVENNPLQINGHPGTPARSDIH